MLLVDTHVWLWMHGEPDRLGALARAQLVDPGVTLFVSAASAWELGIKTALGKLRLGQPVATWWPTRLHASRARELPVTGSHGAAVEALPMLHRDPFDRLLVVQANLEGLTLVTADERVMAYPGRFLDARR
ncbi:MAG: type II toxin-antitoxin system VapC family toxin [Myxococcales bacterium]|nr:type II toxin-antitoxin system VapC family toxin [Myxococcales bacterium]